MRDELQHAGGASGDTGRPVTARRGTVVASLLLIVASVACIGYLHPAVHLDPVRRTISDYAHTAVGAVLLPIGLLAFAGALVLLGRVLDTAGLADRRTSGLLAAAVLGLVLIATFHDGTTGSHLAATDLIHKSGGIMLFGSLPLVGWRLARRVRARRQWARLATPMSRLAAAGAVAFALMLASYLPSLGVALPADGLLTAGRGLLERLILVPEVALVALVAVRLAVLQPPAPAAPLPGAVAAVPAPSRA